MDSLNASASFNVFAGAFFFIILIFMLVGCALYFLGVYGLYTMGKRQNVKHLWLSYIPIAQLYVAGSIIKSFQIYKFNITKPQLVLPMASVATMLLVWIPYVGAIAVLCNAILLLYSLYFFFRKYYADNTAMVYTILGIIIPFLLAIFIFKARNANPIDDQLDS